jgi:hypothetical protein
MRKATYIVDSGVAKIAIEYSSDEFGNECDGFERFLYEFERLIAARGKETTSSVSLSQPIDEAGQDWSAEAEERRRSPRQEELQADAPNYAKVT